MWYSAVTERPLPYGALLSRYTNTVEGNQEPAYTDCFRIDIDCSADLSVYVYSFYTTLLFKLERTVLKYILSRPSSDEDARDLSVGQKDSFSAWTVEDRTEDQLLMCDMRGRTRSWFMVRPVLVGGKPGTSLFFGSAVVPVVNKKTGDIEIGRSFELLMRLHVTYSKLLLHFASAKIHKSQRKN